MAGETSPLAIAYVEIRARGEHFRRDVHATAEQMGRDAGQAAERGFEKEFDPDAAKRLRENRGRFVKAGEDIGRTVGKSAGKTAGDEIADGISKTGRDHRGPFTRAGDEWGTLIGTAAGRAGGRSLHDNLIVWGRKAGDGLEADLSKKITGAFSRTLLGGSGISGKVFSLPGIALATSSVNALGSAMVGTAAAAGTLTGAVAVLPGLALGAAAGFGAMKLATSGVGDAIAAIGTAKFNEKLEVLAPAAQEFVLKIKELRPELRGLRNEVSGAFFDGLTDELESLVKATLPSLKTGLSEISAAFGAGILDVSRLVRSREGLELIDRVLDHTSLSAAQLATALGPAAKGLLDIADVGAAFLPAGAERLADAAERFQRRVAEMKQSGELQAMIRDGLDAFADLGRVVGNTGRIIGGLFSGGTSDTSGLESLARVLGDVADQVNSPAFQSGLGTVFDGIAAGADAIGDAMPDVARALVALAPAIANIAEGAGIAFADVLSDVAGAAEVLAPTLNAVSDVMVTLAPIAGELTVAYLAVKAAMIGVNAAGRATSFIDDVAQKWGAAAVSMRGTAAAGKHARASVNEISGAMEGASAKADRFSASMQKAGLIGGLVTSFTGLVSVFNDYAGGARSTAVATDDLADSLAAFGRTGDFTGAAKTMFEPGAFAQVLTSWEMFGTKIDNSSDAMKEFSQSAEIAFGDGALSGIDRWLSSADEALGGFTQKQDAALSSLVKSGRVDEAAAAYQRLSGVLMDSGASIDEVKERYPQYQSALDQAASALGKTTDELTDQNVQLGINARLTNEAASAILGIRQSQRDYEESLDAATQAAKDNGRTLSDTSREGRNNAAALDRIAESGLNLANQILQNKGTEEEYQQSLKGTRRDLIQAYLQFDNNKQRAKAYADQILQIPKRATTTVLTPGLQRAMSNMRGLQTQINRINGKTYSYTIREILESVDRRDAATARNRVSVGVGHKPVSTRSTGGKIPGFSTGAFLGKIPLEWGGSTADTIPAYSPRGPLMLAGNEFVVRGAVVSQPGVEAALTALNNSYVTGAQALAGFAGGGGLARRASAGLDDLRGAKQALVAAQGSAIQGQGGMSDDQVAALAGAIGAAVAREVRNGMRGLRFKVGDQDLGRIVERSIGQVL